MKKTGITAAGTWIADYTKLISQFPGEGACTAVLSETVNNGGAPYNVLVDLCRLGAPFPLRAVGCVGHDVDGANILKDCHSHSIDATRMRVVDDAPTSFSDVMAAAQTGVRTSFNHAGANARLGPTDFDMASDPSALLYLGTLFFLAGLDAPDPKFGTKAAAVLASARRAGLHTCIDIERSDHVPPAAFQKGCLAALKQTDVVIVNVEVCEVLTGQNVRIPTGVDVDAAAAAALRLAQIGAATCVVIRFPAGALALLEDGSLAVEGSVQIPRARQVNASGAGHAFGAGFLYGFHEGWDVRSSLQAAHAAAAACLTDGTASGGIRNLSACLEMMKKYGQREIQPPQASTPLVPPLLRAG